MEFEDWDVINGEEVEIEVPQEEGEEVEDLGESINKSLKYLRGKQSCLQLNTFQISLLANSVPPTY